MAKQATITLNTAASRELSCRLADTFARRLLGLMGWRGLEPGAGVLFVPGGSIHTAFMRFPIDVVFVDRNGTVVSVAEHLRPWRLASGRGCRFVVELAAGEAERLGIKTGDRLGLAPGSSWEKLRAGRRLPVLRQASQRNG